MRTSMPDLPYTQTHTHTRVRARARAKSVQKVISNRRLPPSRTMCTVYVWVQVGGVGERHPLSHTCVRSSGCALWVCFPGGHSCCKRVLVAAVKTLQYASLSARAL